MQLFNAVLLIKCISLVMCLTQKGRWQKHLNVSSAKSFPCKVPQPRVFFIKDIVDEQQWKDIYEPVQTIIKPVSTILHRCESAGCCDKWNERCMPSPNSIETVKLVFSAWTKIARYYEIEAHNHTECSCQPI